MADISLSKAVRANLNSLTSTASMMAETQNRLSTGNKVNSALDNPSNWFTAKGLNNRAGDLNSLLDGMANGIQTLKAADNGLSAMTKTLESMQSTLRQARQDKSFQTTSLSIDPADIAGPAGQTRQLTLGGGALGTDTVDIALTKSTNATKTAQAAFSPLAVSTGAVAASAGVFTADAADQTFAVKGKDDASAITLTMTGNAAATVDDAIVSFNSQLSASGSSVRVRENGTTPGQIDFFDSKATNTGTGATVAITASAGSAALGITADATTNISATGTNAATAQVSINGHSVTLNGDDHKTADSAAKYINEQLKSQGAAAGLAASVDANSKLVITGPDDGTGVTLGGSDVAAVFGTTADTAAAAAGDAAGKAKTVDELVAEINSKFAADGTSPNPLNGKIRASNDNGKLRIENQSTQKLDITGASGGKVLGTTVSTSEVAGNSVRAGLASQFNELRDQLDKLADDASFNGINLMRGDKLTITFNETGTSSIDISTKNGQTINSANLGVPTSLVEKQLDSDTDIDGLLTDMKTALDSVRSQASTFGSNLSIVQNRQDFTRAMIDTLETGAGNLTLADMNEEAANLLALQTRQQLSSNSLSLASQADQSVLQLLR